MTPNMMHSDDESLKHKYLLYSCFIKALLENKIMSKKYVVCISSLVCSAFLVLTTRIDVDIHSPKDTLRVFPFWKMQNAHD